MSYEKELTKSRAAKATRLSLLMAKDKLTTRDREQAAELVIDMNDLNDKIDRERNGDYDHRGDTGNERTTEDKSYLRFLRTGLETRDGVGLSTAPNSSGLNAGPTGSYAGYMIPQSYWLNLQIALKAYGGTGMDFKQIHTDDGRPMPWATNDPTSVLASVLGVSGELTQLSPTNPYNFGEGLLQAWPYVTDPILASVMLVEDSAFDVDGFVNDRINEQIGRKVAADAINGTGTGEMLGLNVAVQAKGNASVGTGGYYTLSAGTSVNILNATTTTELIGNLLNPVTVLDMIKSVDPAYRDDENCKFYMNDAQLQGMRTVADTLGRPLYPSLSAGLVPSLYGYPIVVDNNIANLTASTVTGPYFGNLQKAMVMRQVRTGATVMRLVERFADYLAVAYIGHSRIDARSNDMRAICGIKAAGT